MGSENMYISYIVKKWNHDETEFTEKTEILPVGIQGLKITEDEMQTQLLISEYQLTVMDAWEDILSIRIFCESKTDYQLVNNSIIPALKGRFSLDHVCIFDEDGIIGEAS